MRWPPGSSAIWRSSAASRRPPASPSAARWSMATFTHIRGRTPTSPSSATGLSATRPVATMATCGPDTTGAKKSTGWAPRFDSVHVPPERSWPSRLPCRAASTRRLRSRATSTSASESASRSTGATTPSAVATAIERWTGRLRSTEPSGRRRAFSSGTSPSARASATTSTSVTVTVAPADARAWITPSAASSPPMWTWGICCQLAVMFATTAARRRSSATVAALPFPAGVAPRSRATIRPPGPVPRTSASSTPRSRAIRRAAGDAIGPEPRRGAATVGAARRPSTAGAGAAAAPSSRSSSARDARAGSSSASTPSTATTAPSAATIRRTPEPGASISTVALSVSTSTTS